MITDEERRKIAARLRQRRKEMDNERCPRIPSLAATVYLLEISRAVKCGESMVSLISVVKGLLRQKVVMGMMLDILIGTAAINRALDAAEGRAND